jgi:hypothetical protein
VITPPITVAYTTVKATSSISELVFDILAPELLSTTGTTDFALEFASTHPASLS